MISYLEGVVKHKEEKYVVLNVSGVGYKISATQNTLEPLKIGSSASFWTHLAVREDALDLYGFTDRDALGFFELLISISGIGPKTALGVLNIAGVKTLRQAVSTGDTSYLTKVSGIGKKIAEKIVLELRGKFEAEDFEGSVEGQKGEADALDALKSLGYSERNAREALKKLPKNDKGEMSAGEKVKQALKILSSGK